MCFAVRKYIAFVHRHALGELVSPASIRWLSSGSVQPDSSLAASSSALEAASNALTVASTSSSAASEPWGPLHACMTGLDAVHTTLGLPWWATLSLLAVGVRGVMFPVALKGMRAGAALSLLPGAQSAAARQWEAGAAGRRRRGSGAAGPVAEVAGSDGDRQDVRTTPPGSGGLAAAGRPASSDAAQGPGTATRGPPLPLVARHLNRLRQEAGLPHPSWLLGAPVLQIPFFIAGMATARGLAAARWPGLETGGLAWFSDLTLPALEYSSLTAPMGSLGLVLPAAVILSISNVLDGALRVPEGEATPAAAHASLARFALPYVRLAIDIGLIPLFIIALQVPQGERSSACLQAAASSRC